MNMLLNWGQRCAQGKARSKSAAVRFWGRHDYWEQVPFRVHYKVILFNLFGSHLKLWLLPLKRLHTFFPSMCRPAPLRLKWFTAGHITTVIRDRRIYNFLSLNTSLRIVFFTTAPFELCFTDSALYCFLCRPCCLCLPSLWRGGYSDINRACVEMFEPPLSPSAGEDQDCGASVPCARALRGTEERHGEENGVKQE